MAWWLKLWHKITKPSENIKARDAREQASIYAVVTFLVIALAIFLIILTLVFQIIPYKFLPILFASLAVYVGLYALSRSIYFRWSARFFLWLAISFIFYSAIYLVPEDKAFVLNFLVIPIMISGFVLPYREAILNTIITTLFIVATITLNDAFFRSPLSISLLIIFVGIIAIVASILINRYRQTALENERRFRSLLEANYEGILFIDGETAQILDANPAIAQILGYPIEEIIGCYPIEFVIPADKPVTRNLWNHRSENIPIDIEVLHKNGHQINVEVRLRPYHYRDNKAYVLTVLDISDRKQAENFILESEERFRAIFNESVHYIGVLDATGRILELNDRSHAKFGVRAQDVIGKYLYEFEQWAYSEKAKVRVKSIVEKAIQGETIRYETQVYDKNKKVIYVDFALTPIIDSDGITSLIIAESRDITDYRLAEIQRREFEQRYRALFEDTTDAVFIYTVEGQLLDANKRAEEMLKISREEMLNYTVSHFVAEDHKKESAELLGTFQKGTHMSTVPERLMKRATGEVFYAETLGMVVVDETGKARYVQSMVRDISERKRMEEERFQTALETERTQFLAHFIENASHHFRTPITNMKTRMYLLSRVLDKPDKRDEQIDILNQNLERLQNILSDLLMVLRLQKDDTEYTPAKIHVNLLLNELRQSFEGRTDYDSYTWDWQLDEQNPLLFVDKGLLVRALMNIVENAITYTPEDGDITVRTYSRKDYVVFDIVDSGKGISEEELAHVFDDFYRGQESMQADSTSSGLGLSIVRMIAERYGGKVFVKSSVDSGSHFQIILPHYHEGETIVPELPKEMLTLVSHS